MTLGLTNDFRVILFITLASARGRRSKATETVARLQSYNAAHCTVLPGGEPRWWESSRSTMAAAFQWKHCGIMAARTSTSTKTTDQLPRHSGNFSASSFFIKVTRRGEEKKNYFCSFVRMIHRCCFCIWRVQSDKDLNLFSFTATEG